MAHRRFRFRILMCLLLGAILIGLPAGCGLTDPDGTTVVSTTATDGTIQTTTGGSTALTSRLTTAADSNINAPGLLPVVRESETLVISLYGSSSVASFASGDNALTDWLEEQTNVKLEFLIYPAAGNNILTYNNLGDLCLLPSTPLDRRTEMDLGTGGKLEPLNALLDTYGHHILSLMDAVPYARALMSAPNGLIYSFPRGMPDTIRPEAYGMRLWIHREFLTKSGLGMPTTTEELADFLSWVVLNDPNGNGQPDEIGWSGSDKRSVPFARPTDFLMNAFSLQNENGLYQQEGLIKAAFVEDSYREGLKYLADLMESGLMDPEYATHDKNELSRLISRQDGRRVAVFSSEDLTFIEDMAVRNLYEIVPPLQGPAEFSSAYFDYYTGIEAGAAFIPADSEKKELATAWMDSLYEQEVAWRALYGQREVDWDVPVDGTRAVDGGSAQFRIIRELTNKSHTAHWGLSSPVMWDRIGPLASPAAGNEQLGLLYDAARRYEPSVILCAVPPLFFPEPAVEDRANLLFGEIDRLHRSIVKEFIYGIRDVHDDTAWGGFVSEIDRAGLAEYLEILQTAFTKDWKNTLPEMYEPFPQR